MLATMYPATQRRLESSSAVLLQEPQIPHIEVHTGYSTWAIFCHSY